MARSGRAALAEHAPGKINLTLEVCGRRSDGYHELASLIVFARLSDRLRFFPGEPLGLGLRGSFAASLGTAQNLVLVAAEALRARIEGLRLGRFELDKRLPVAAGIGGGSSDAAAALRLLACANALDAADPRLLDAALATGADVPVCLAARACLVSGIGGQLSQPLGLPALPAVLVNPAVPLATKDVFAQFDARPNPSARPPLRAAEIPGDRARLLALLDDRKNALEDAAIALEPVIADVLAELRAIETCELARMSGSGATCFGLFKTARAALAAARHLRAAHPRWWVHATTLG